MIKWAIEISLTEEWVADGFDISSEEKLRDFVQSALENYIPVLYGHEFECRVLSSPDKNQIKKLQGE